MLTNKPVYIDYVAKAFNLYPNEYKDLYYYEYYWFIIKPYKLLFMAEDCAFSVNLLQVPIATTTVVSAGDYFTVVFTESTDFIVLSNDFHITYKYKNFGVTQ